MCFATETLVENWISKMFLKNVKDFKGFPKDVIFKRCWVQPVLFHDQEGKRENSCDVQENPKSIECTLLTFLPLLQSYKP